MWHFANPFSGAARRFCTLLLVSAGLLATQQAQACQLPPGLQQLTIQLSSAATSPGDATGQSRAVRTLLSDSSESRLMADLADSGQRELQPLALDLLAQGQQLAADGFVARPSTVQALLSQMDRALVASCEASPDDESAFSTAVSWLAGDGSDDADGFWGSGSNRPAQAGMLMGALAGFIILVCLADFSYRQIMAIVYNRKMCLIPSQIDTGTAIISGHVITLGRGGFRFEPSPQAGDEALKRSVSSLIVHLDISGLRFAARPSALVEPYADFRLEEALSLSNQKMLLSASVISPFYVRKARASLKDAECEGDARPAPVFRPRSATAPSTARHTAGPGTG